MDKREFDEAICNGAPLQVRNVHGGWSDMHDRDPHSIDPEFMRVKPGAVQLWEQVKRMQEELTAMRRVPHTDVDAIVYLATHHGINGRDRESIRFASFDERTTQDWIDANPDRNWLSFVMRVIKVKPSTDKAMRRIDGLDRLLLGIEQEDK